MRKEVSKKRRNRFKLFKLAFLLGLVFTMALIILVSTLSRQRFGPLHKIAFESIGPLLKIVDVPSSYLRQLKNKYVSLMDIHEENKRLWTELRECRNNMNQTREAIARNIRLQKLLDFKDSSHFPVVAASIIGKDPSLWFRTVIIDRGTSDGLLKGMPAVTDSGIVGQILAVSPNYAKVLLAIAPSSAIDVVLQKSRIRGILKGTGTLTYRLDYILKNVDVKKGDRVVTAGYGGVFPTGLPVGTVSNIVRKQRGMFQEIEVTPSTDFLTLEELLVIQREIPFSD